MFWRAHKNQDFYNGPFEFSTPKKQSVLVLAISSSESKTHPHTTNLPQNHVSPSASVCLCSQQSEATTTCVDYQSRRFNHKGFVVSVNMLNMLQHHDQHRPFQATSCPSRLWSLSLSGLLDIVGEVWSYEEQFWN